jgi:hypothetical protein
MEKSASLLRVAEKCSDENETGALNVSGRRDFFSKSTGVGALVVGTLMMGFPDSTYAKSYSENAKNLERINAGDFSGTLSKGHEQLRTN